MDSHPSKHRHFPRDLMRYLNELRMRVHRYRRYGLLPRGGAAPHFTSRRGSGLACLLCGEPVLPTEPEILVECHGDPELALERPVYRLHHLCHVIWLTEAPARRRRLRDL
jgi:hypothetical protein